MTSQNNNVPITRTPFPRGVGDRATALRIERLNAAALKALNIQDRMETLLQTGLETSIKMLDSTETEPVKAWTTTSDFESRVTLNQGISYILSPDKACTTQLTRLCTEVAILRMLSAERAENVAGALSLIAIMFPGSFDLSIVKTAIKNTRQNVEVVTVSTVLEAYDRLGFLEWEDLDLFKDAYGLANDPANPQIYITKIPDVNRKEIGGVRDVAYLYAFTGIILASMGKNISALNYENWRANRWKAFCGSCGVSPLYGCLFKNLVLPLSAWTNMSRFFSTAHQLRKTVVEGMQKVMAEDTPIGKICDAALKYLKWAEMTHIVLINKYIFKLYPHILHMDELRPYINDYLKCLEKIQECARDSSQWCYLKLTEPISETGFLNRNRFTLLIAVANEIGRHHMSSLEQYQGAGKLTATMEAIRDKAVRLALKADFRPLDEQRPMTQTGVKAAQYSSPLVMSALENAEAEDHLLFTTSQD